MSHRQREVSNESENTEESKNTKESICGKIKVLP